ncbi:MAG: aminotransferase class V-fold PLP-dependent enzyme [Planctomycetota bacterium]
MSTTPNRIYCDHAATSWPKPESVYLAMDRYARDQGAAAGRGGYLRAVEAGRCVTTARQAIARLITVADERRIVFCSNGTDALNLALHGLVRPGDHVVTTTAEHNSVLRPLAWLARRQGVAVDHVGCRPDGRVEVAQLLAAIRPTTRLVAVVHASNVTGAVNDIESLAAECQQRSVLLLVDAAQSVGQWPLQVSSIGPDLIAAPGHKSLLGPIGTGWLYVGPRAERELQPIRQGGSGGDSEREEPPAELPERFEAGNLNVPALVGLEAGVREVERLGIAHLQSHHARCTQQFLDGVVGLPGVQLVGPRAKDRRVGVVSLLVEGYDPQELAGLLDGEFGIETRAGLHCAPRLHQSIGTFASGGTVRFSFGNSTTEGEVAVAIEALRALTGAGS